MSIYDNLDVKNRKDLVASGVRLTPHQAQKLESVCHMFGITRQRFWSDCIDYFYMDTINVQSGHISINGAIKDSMQKMMDEYVDLNTVKGIQPVEYSRPPSHGRSTPFSLVFFIGLSTWVQLLAPLID